MRKLMWFTIGGVAACLLSVYLLPLDMLGTCTAVCSVGFTAILILSFFYERVKPLVAGLLGATVLFGWNYGFDAYYLQNVRALDGETVELAVTLTDYSKPTQYGIVVEGMTQIDGKTYRIWAYDNDPGLSLKPGDSLIGTFQIKDTTGKEGVSPQHKGNGIFLIGYPRGEIYHRIAPEIPWYGYPAYLSASIQGLLHSTFPEDTVGFAQALLLGDTSLIDYETDTAFKLSGIRHIIAVSGLHVSILFALISQLTGRKRWLSVLLGLPVLLLFAAVAGFTPSITRACIMHSLMILSMLLEREYDPPTALSFAVLLMLFANPYCVSSVGLQLSAGCMCGIFLFSGKIQEWFLDSRRLGRFRGKAKKFAAWFASCVAVTLSATLVTTPLCAFYFGTVSLISPVTNLLTLWVITFIFYGIVLGCILALIWLPLGRVLGWVVSWPIRYVLQVAKLAAAFPLAAVYTASIYIVIFLFFAYVLLAVFLAIKRKHPAMLVCCLILCLCICLGASWVEPLCDDVRMTVLDVGQGQAIVLQSEGKTFLVDCGGDSDTAAADAAAEKLLSMGISRLDGLILTHYDRDHAGGAIYLLSRIRADALYLPDCIDTDGYSEPLKQMPQAVMVDDHMQISFGAVTIKLITTDYGISNNESGLCVLFQRENCDILITGDRNSYGEKDLLRQIDLPDLEVLIVGHHGSKYSTSVELLQAGRPDIAIISVGENSYGHPTKEVLDRLTEFGCTVYRTDQQGTITFRR